MSGLEQRLDLSQGDNPIWYAAGCRGALCVPGSGGEISLVVYGTLGDIGVAPTADLLRHGQGSEPVVGGGGVSLGGERLVSSAVEERDSVESPVVMGCVSVSVMTNTRPDALWRAPPPLAFLRMSAWISWHAALWRLIRKVSWSKHSPAICVQESGL